MPNRVTYDENIFPRELEGKNWDTFANSDDPSDMWNCFETNITNVLDRMCPIKQLVVPESEPDWLTNDVVQLIRKRDKMYKDARRKKDPTTWRKATFLEIEWKW